MGMKEFEGIVGYTAIKTELERIADALRSPAPYRAIGVTPPRGLLLYGQPGVGKTTMADALLRASGRSVFLCRKEQSNGDFMQRIAAVFAAAAEAAPSVVLLDDLDKFAVVEDDCENEEEFVAVQSGIDSLRGKDVFVLATANEIDVLPKSLLRPGRFDKIIRIGTPTVDEARQIAAHYLAPKRVAPDVSPDMIARILSGRSCAALETALNAAGLLAGFDRAETITMRHVVMGCIETVQNIPPDLIVTGMADSLDDPQSETAACAWHEAGHAAALEILKPGGVTLVCIHEPLNGAAGFTMGVERSKNFADARRDVICSLAGGAATLLQYGVKDPGAAGDYEHAKELLQMMIAERGYCGLSLLNSAEFNSDALRAEIEQAVTHELRQCCGEATRILAENRRFLRALARALLESGLLTGDDVRRLRAECA